MSHVPQRLTAFITLCHWLLPCALWCACTGIALAAAPSATPTDAPKPAPKLLNAQGPGTQTEDGAYVGKKIQANSLTTPAGTKQAQPSTVKAPQMPVQGLAAAVKPKLLPRPGAGVSPNTDPAAKKKQGTVSGGDDDLNDLEVERRKLDASNTLGARQPDTGRGIVPLPRPQLQK